MADFGISWGLARPVDVGGSFLAGWEHGQQQRRQNDVRGALAAFSSNPQDKGALALISANDPRLGAQLQQQQREEAIRQATAAVFSPGGANGLVDTNPNRTQAEAVQELYSDARSPFPPQAPSGLVDPSALPPRTDGMQVNQEALRNLYAVDPATAMQIQKSVFDATKAQAEQMRESGKVMASAAYHLSQVPADQRQSLLSKMAGTLRQYGISDDVLRQADLSDDGLKSYIVMGQNIGSLLDDQRAEKKLEADLSNMERDNARADRSEARQELYRARSDARAARADGRAAVRFKERDKDRAALAAGVMGLRTDTSDLDY